MKDYFILILYFGFLFIYATHPRPIIFYRNNKLNECNVSNDKICLEE